MSSPLAPSVWDLVAELFAVSVSCRLLRPRGSCRSVSYLVGNVLAASLLDLATEHVCTLLLVLVVLSILIEAELLLSAVDSLVAIVLLLAV